MKVQYEAPQLVVEEFRFSDVISLSADPPPGYDDTNGWSPVKPIT